MEHKPIGNEKEVNHKKERILHFVLDFLGVTCIAVFFYVAFPIFNFFETGRLETDDLARFICVGAVYIMSLIYILVKHLRKGNFKKKYYSTGSFMASDSHKCHSCHNKMKVKNRHKVVEKHSEEGRYYEFSTRYYSRFGHKSYQIEDYHHGLPVERCEFIHQAYYCPHCDTYIEFVTQHSIDKIDKYFTKISKKKGLKFNKKFLDQNGNELSFPKDIERITLCEVSLFDGEGKVQVYKFPVKRLQQNERAHYFDISSIK